jgi:hypothetical protein
MHDFSRTFGFHSRLSPVLLSLAALVTMCAPHARANAVLFTAGPTTLGSNEISASARFEFNPTSHTIAIYLLNLEANPSDITQVLGSIRFTLTGAGASPTPTISSVEGNTFGVDANGSPIAKVESIAWTVSNIGGTQLALCTVCASGGNKDLLIGGPNISGIYANANGSIAGNKPHNPFVIASNGTYASGVLHGLDTSPTWTISVPTETVNVAVSKVIFGFGTGTNYGTNTIEVDNFQDLGAPEPGSLIMMLGGLGLILIGVRKRRSR